MVGRLVGGKVGRCVSAASIRKSGSKDISDIGIQVNVTEPDFQKAFFYYQQLQNISFSSSNLETFWMILSCFSQNF